MKPLRSTSKKKEIVFVFIKTVYEWKCPCNCVVTCFVTTTQFSFLSCCMFALEALRSEKCKCYFYFTLDKIKFYHLRDFVIPCPTSSKSHFIPLMLVYRLCVYNVYCRRFVVSIPIKRPYHSICSIV